MRSIQVVKKHPLLQVKYEQDHYPKGEVFSVYMKRFKNENQTPIPTLLIKTTALAFRLGNTIKIYVMQ